VKQWDSLAAMKLVSAIEEKFKIRLSTKEIMKMSTIGLARKTLRSKNVAV
jgi:acyl carrier protein